MHHSERCDIFLQIVWHTSVVTPQWRSTG